MSIIIGLAITDMEWLYLGLLMIPAMTYLCIEKPFYFPFGMYVLFLPFDSIALISDSLGTITKILGVLTILILPLKGLYEKKLQLPNSVIMWWLLLIIYGALSVMWAMQPESVISIMPTMAGLFILYLVVSSYKIQMSEYITLKYFALTGGFVAALYTIYNFAAGLSYLDSSRGTMMVGGRTTDPNTFAFSLLIPLSICVNLMLKQSRIIVKCLYLTMLFVFLLCFVYTGSRGGLVGSGIIFVVHFLQGKRKLSFAAVLVITVFALMPFVPSFFVERLDQAAETGGAGRMTIWNNALIALEQYWLMGTGLNNFPVAYKELGFLSHGYQVVGRAAHNIYFAIFVELGIIGISLMILGMAKHYLAIGCRFSSLNNEQVMLRGAFWGVLVSSFFLDTYSSKSFWLLWMMILLYRKGMEHSLHKIKQTFI